MRISIATLMLACVTAIPLCCQTEQERELKACGPKENEVKYVTDTDKKRHPAGEQAADKSLIYILRPAMMGNKIQTKLAVDGEWKGANRGNNYFFFSLQPGQHYFF